MAKEAWWNNARFSHGSEERYAGGVVDSEDSAVATVTEPQRSERVRKSEATQHSRPTKAPRFVDNENEEGWISEAGLKAIVHDIHGIVEKLATSHGILPSSSSSVASTQPLGGVGLLAPVAANVRIPSTPRMNAASNQKF